MAELNEEVIDITVEHSLRIQSPRTSYPIFQLGGAIKQVRDDETAFNGRKAGHTYYINGLTPGDNGEGFAEEREWARGLWDALAPFTPASMSISSWTTEKKAFVGPTGRPSTSDLRHSSATTLRTSSP